MDIIKIKDLEVYCNHGVFKEENILGQKFLVSVSLMLDTKRAGKSDAMEDSISYADAAHFIKKFMKERTFKLLEAAAENLAEAILLSFPLTEQVRVEIKKPWAPILLPLDTVSVEILRGWHTAYIAAGANLGDKEGNIRKAIELLGKDERTRVNKVSGLIETEPMGGVEQDNFLNGALEIATLRSPLELLSLIGEIENALKRVRTIHWGPRTIDLDIILYDDLVMNTKTLTIPHTGMGERDFVLRPMMEIAPWAIHPVFHKSVYELYQDLLKAGI